VIWTNNGQTDGLNLLLKLKWLWYLSTLC